MIKLINIKLPFDFDEDKLKTAAAGLLRIEPSTIKEIRLIKLSDVIDGDKLYKKATAALCLESAEAEVRAVRLNRKNGVSFMEPLEYDRPRAAASGQSRPVIIGFGPAGIFAGLILAQAGLMPIILERGYDADRRLCDIALMREKGILSEQSNIQFGEGGAGTFSDGKLKIGAVDARKFKILSELVSAGANEKILYSDKPHIGSDVLPTVVKNLRKKIISLGGEVRFEARFTELLKSGNRVCGVRYASGEETHEIECDNVILAIGHSARDTFEYLYSDGLKMRSKGFGVGVRIEHPQSLINKIKYGVHANNLALGAADYKLVTHLKNGRSVYSFCMCPGGYVVCAASEKNRICTNGMSEFARDGANANSALLVSVTPEDFGSAHPLAGIEYQRKIETDAFYAAGGNYYAPVTRLCDFLENRKPHSLGEVKPTYLPGTAFVMPEEYFPDYITQSLREALYDMFDWMPDYRYGDAVITGPETRTTSPVRIIRSDSLEAEGIQGLYPCGEGAGYAGGIISAALDGILCAERIINKIRK